jgi:hypothetical protein
MHHTYTLKCRVPADRNQGMPNNGQRYFYRFALSMSWSSKVVVEQYAEPSGLRRRQVTNIISFVTLALRFSVSCPGCPISALQGCQLGPLSKKGNKVI